MVPEMICSPGYFSSRWTNGIAVRSTEMEVNFRRIVQNWKDIPTSQCSSNNYIPTNGSNVLLSKARQ